MIDIPQIDSCRLLQTVFAIMHLYYTQCTHAGRESLAATSTLCHDEAVLPLAVIFHPLLILSVLRLTFLQL